MKSKDLCNIEIIIGNCHVEQSLIESIHVCVIYTQISSLENERRSFEKRVDELQNQLVQSERSNLDTSHQLMTTQTTLQRKVKTAAVYSCGGWLVWWGQGWISLLCGRVQAERCNLDTPHWFDPRMYLIEFP